MAMPEEKLICMACGHDEYYVVRDFPDQEGIKKCRECGTEMLNPRAALIRASRDTPVEISSVTMLPAEWCDILRQDYSFVTTATTRNRQQVYTREWPDDNFYEKNEQKDPNIWWEPDDPESQRKHGEHFVIIVDEPMITTKLLRDKYIPMLNKWSEEQFVYVKDFSGEVEAVPLK